MRASRSTEDKTDLENSLVYRIVEVLFPLCIALFAAMLSINDLLSDDVRSLELKLGNIRNNNYQWYQSKGIKATIMEGQRELLSTLLISGSIGKAQQKHLKNMLVESDKKIQRYNKEKKEILLGSKAVGEANWVQDVDGKMGLVIGAQEYDAALVVLERSDNFFDYASMLFQIAMVVGAIGIMLPKPKVRLLFLMLMLSLGVAGFALGGRGYSIATTVEFFN